MRNFEPAPEGRILSDDFYRQAYQVVQEHRDIFESLAEWEVEVGELGEYSEVPKQVENIESEVPGLVEYRFPEGQENGYVVPTYLAEEILGSNAEDADTFAEIMGREDERSLESYRR